MNICLVIGGKLTKLAGLEKHFIELANLLSNKINVSVVAHKSYYSHLSNNINFIPLDLNVSRFNPILYIKLYKILNSGRFDIVHSQANKATYIMSKLKIYFPNIKFVATLHNKKNKINYYNKMDCVIGVSNFVLEQININKKVIYNGLDLKRIDATSDINIKKEFNISNKFPIIVSVGRLVYAKGFDILIKAVKDLDVNLIIVGDGQLSDELYKLIKNLNLSDKVFIAGFKDNALSYIKSSDLSVISSRFEGFSYVFAETLILEKPLISTDVADIKYFIPNDYLVEIDNVLDLSSTIINYFTDIKYDFNDYYKRARYSFDIDIMVKETIETYMKELRK